MKNASWLLVAVMAGSLGCAGEPPPPPESPPPPPPVAAPPPVEAAKPVEPPPPPEPTPEEKKKAEAAKQLAEDRAKMEVDTKAENDRWTAEMHSAAKALASAKYPTLKAALTAALAGKHRNPASVVRDKHRHPQETLAHFGLTPGMTVLEMGPGEGYMTELLAPTLAAKGKLMVTSADPNGPADQRSTYYGERLKRFLDRAPELYGTVDRIIFDSKAPKLGMEGKLDMVIMMRAMHGLHRDKLLNGVLAEIFKSLKVGGIFGVEQHRAKLGAAADDVAKDGYLPEEWLIKQIEAAGFQLAPKGKSEVNGNPKDTKDYKEGVWTLPPSLALKDQDRQKYIDIGESDRMTLKFVKPKKK